mmetsp:Transcript_27667/g.66533  ORF Transcript_27667/g.66533 Transcript_27667/m.66533 type:complete len:517 (+) Transcript_27667:98-1648(+)
MDEDAMMTNADEGGAAVGGVDNAGDVQDDIADDTPAFIDMQDAVEVQVDEENRPMEEEEEDEGAMRDGTDADADVSPSSAEDDSKFQFTSHTDAVYAVAAAVDTQTGQLSILSGGGDDKSFLCSIPTAVGTQQQQQQQPVSIPHPFKDTVSSVVYNWQYVADPTDSKTPRLAAIGSYDGSILLYDTTNISTVAAPLQPKLQLEGPSDVEWMAFHPKGGTVLLVGSGDASVWMFHLPLNRCLQVFVGHEQAVTCGSFSPDGKWALSASSDGTLRIWAPKTGMNKHVFRFVNNNNNGGGPPAGLTCMATGGGSDAALVMVGGEDGIAHVCHIGTKKVVATLRHFEPTNGMASHQGAGDDEMEYPMSVEAVGFCPIQPTWCATGGVDGKLKIWDLSRDGGQLRHVCNATTTPTTPDQQEEGGAAAGVVDSITRLQWHPTLPLVFTSHVTGNVKLWDARNGTLVHTLHGGNDQINDMDIQFSSTSPNIAYIVTASDDKTIRMFELDVNAAMQKVATTTTA